MSIFTVLAARLGIPDSEANEWGEQFRRFPALKRSSREVIDMVTGPLHDKFMAIPNDFIPADMWARMDSLRDQALASWNQAIDLENQIVEVFNTARSGGEVEDDVFADAMRQCGLEETDLGAIPFLIVGAVVVVILAAIAIWRSDAIARGIADAIVAFDRGIQLNRTEAHGFDLAMDQAIAVARANNAPVKLPPRPNTEKSTTQTLADTATSVTGLAVIGIGLIAAAKIFGGRRK